MNLRTPRDTCSYFSDSDGKCTSFLVAPAPLLNKVEKYPTGRGYLSICETGRNFKKRLPYAKRCSAVASILTAKCFAPWDWVSYNFSTQVRPSLHLHWFSTSHLCNGTYCQVWLMIVVSEKRQYLSLHSRAEKLLLFGARYSIFK